MAHIPSESEDENLSDSDDDFVPNRSEIEQFLTSEDEISEDELPTDATFKRKKTFGISWTKVASSTDFVQPQFTAEDREIGRPIHYFQLFFTDELLSIIIEQSNFYACQTDVSKPLNLTTAELETYIGTVIYMSIFGLPRHRIYWSSACRVAQVADVISRKRWEEIKKTFTSIITQICPGIVMTSTETNYLS